MSTFDTKRLLVNCNFTRALSQPPYLKNWFIGYFAFVVAKRPCMHAKGLRWHLCLAVFRNVVYTGAPVASKLYFRNDKQQHVVIFCFPANPGVRAGVMESWQGTNLERGHVVVLGNIVIIMLLILAFTEQLTASIKKWVTSRLKMMVVVCHSLGCQIFTNHITSVFRTVSSDWVFPLRGRRRLTACRWKGNIFPEAQFFPFCHTLR